MNLKTEVALNCEATPVNCETEITLQYGTEITLNCGTETSLNCGTEITLYCETGHTFNCGTETHLNKKFKGDCTLNCAFVCKLITLNWVVSGCKMFYISSGCFSGIT